MTPKKILHPCLLVASLAFCNLAVGQEAVAAEHDPRSIKTMNRCDKDGDDKMSEEEFISTAKDDEAKKAKKLKAFKKFDVDLDGFITYDELDSRFATMVKK